MKWKCKKCDTYMHDQENSFYVYDYNRGTAIEFSKKGQDPFESRGYKSRKPNGEIWRCPKCDNIQFDKKDWIYKGEIFDFEEIAKELGIKLGKDNWE